MLSLRQIRKKADMYTENQGIPETGDDTASPTQHTDTLQGPGVGNMSGDFKPFEDNERDKESASGWAKQYPRLKKLLRQIQRPNSGGSA